MVCGVGFVMAGECLGVVMGGGSGGVVDYEVVKVYIFG